MIQFQQQPTENSCMSACVAMVSAQPVKDVVQRWHDAFHDRSEWIDDALDFYKIPYFYGHPRNGELLYGFVYFLTVPSLNVKGGLHQVLMSLTADRKNIEVLDPNMGRDGCKYYVWGPEKAEDQATIISWTVDIAVPMLVLQ